MDAIAAIAAIAARQYGILTRDQLLSCGLSGEQVKRWLRSGRIRRLHSGVYRVAGAPVVPEGELLAAVFAAGPGAVASHRAAAWLWELIEATAVEVTVPPGRSARLRGVSVHRAPDVNKIWVGRRRGIPVTSPMRALVDLGAVSPELVEDALDEGLIARYFTVDAVEAELERVGHRGRSGAGVLREVLVRRALEDGIPDSRLEPVMARLARRYNLPRAQFQYVVRDGDRRFIGRVDFAYPEAKLVIEIDGWSSRATPRRLDEDLHRQNRLVLAGWTVLRFTKRRLLREPAKVADRIRSVLIAKGVA